ncbi:hypothetical protein HHK36_004413 [Tetracentron sinense]|uniref:Helicase C-terminal domain-containing protein n=1 Tax=Tetracentron sinense TaxID=13715 RepID=A0A834ZPZ2_TETSI|nr:hypothetical protein HHK36_004413 [Tetracentron sinense]
MNIVDDDDDVAGVGHRDVPRGCPGKGGWKLSSGVPAELGTVIVATDIAETSITIDDVIYVIDCGKHKENRYNPQKKLSSMVEDWISQANARQRRGRAGRVKPGFCFCLYTRHRFEKLMRPFQVPEMLRMPLAIEPPREEAMTSAVATLYEVGAIEGDEELTPLGYHLAKLPVDVLIGKRHNVERAKVSLLTDKLDGASDSNEGDRQSDHLLMVVAYKKWARILREKGVKAAQNFCNSYCLSSSVLYMISSDHLHLDQRCNAAAAMIAAVLLPAHTDGKLKDKLDDWFADISQPFNMYSHHSSVVKSILCAGLYPNVAATEQGIVGVALGSNFKSSASPVTNGRPHWFDGRREVHIHPSSINSNSKVFQYPFLVFLEKVETNKVFLRDTSIISPYSILLFGGAINIQHQTGLVTLDGWLKLTAPAQTAVLFKELRLTLHSVLKELIKKPETATVVNNEVVRSIVHLLLEEDKPPK